MHKAILLPAIAGTTILLASAAWAGSGNTITVIQERTFGTEGNTLTVDQSQADHSLVRGLLDEAARQKGNDNEATLTLEGYGGVIQLLQDNSFTRGAGNAAVVNAGANSIAAVAQIGSGNLATLDVSGTLARGTVLQTGSGNNANLTVEGTGANGLIAQIGRNNVTTLEVSGASVNYTVIGNNLSNAGGPQVYSNGATVTITQTRY